MLKEQLGGRRLRLTDDQRRRLERAILEAEQEAVGTIDVTSRDRDDPLGLTAEGVHDRLGERPMKRFERPTGVVGALDQ